jgi:hypothetical protein
VNRLVAMQSQEHAHARWSVAQRVSPVAAAAADVDRAFDDGEILRTHVLRPTWHYVAREDLRWLLGLSGPIVDRRNARRYANLELDAETLARGSAIIAREVADAPRTRAELGAALAQAGIAPDGQRLPHLVMHAEFHRLVCSGPMRGKHHSYAAFDARVPADAGPQGDDAAIALARRYFTTRGPATIDDFIWWSWLPAATARKAVAAAELQEWDVDGRAYFLVEDDVPPARGRVDLVQCYDEAIISYRESRDVLQTPSATFPVPATVDGFTHVLLLDGRLLGHWRLARERSGMRVETRVAGRVSAGVKTELDRAVARYEHFASASR